MKVLFKMFGREIIKSEKTKGFSFGKTQAYLMGFGYTFINFWMKLAANLLWPRRVPKSPKNICIYRIGNIGDMLCTIPAMIAVRRAYPETRITLLTSPGGKGRPGARELMGKAWFLDEMWVYYSDEIAGKNALSFAKKVRSRKFDLLVYFPQELITLPVLLRNLIFIRLCGVKKAVGFEFSTIKTWARIQSMFYVFDTEIDRLARLLRRWDIPTDGKIELELPIPGEIEKLASEKMERLGLKNKTLVGFMPGASYEDNRWAPQNFASLGKMILKRHPDFKILVFGGPGDKERAAFIKKEIGGDSVVDLSGIPLLETAYFVKNLKLLVSNNTGLMHMGTLFGINVLAIFCPIELNGKWFPYGPSSKVLLNRSRKECDGYYYKSFPGSNECINIITSEEVLEESEKIFK